MQNGLSWVPRELDITVLAAPCSLKIKWVGAKQQEVGVPDAADADKAQKLWGLTENNYLHNDQQLDQAL